MDYQQTEITGQQWHRFSQILIENRRNETPFVRCLEQEVTVLQNGEIVRDVSPLNFMFDPALEFEVLNPLTNEPTGTTSTGADVYTLVFSYVMAMAKKRDNAVVTPLAPAPPLP